MIRVVQHTPRLSDNTGKVYDRLEDGNESLLEVQRLCDLGLTRTESVREVVVVRKDSRNPWLQHTSMRISTVYGIAP